MSFVSRKLNSRSFVLSSFGLSLLALSACSSNSDSSLDANGDGVLDSLGTAADYDKDGVNDWIDINGDGVLDGLGVDTNGDGIVDALGIDTDGDGIVDQLQYANGDVVNGSGGSANSGGGTNTTTGGGGTNTTTGGGGTNTATGGGSATTGGTGGTTGGTGGGTTTGGTGGTGGTTGGTGGTTTGGTGGTTGGTGGTTTGGTGGTTGGTGGTTTGGTGGTTTGGTGGTTGGTGGTGGTSTGGTSSSASWPTASYISDSMLSSAYTTWKTGNVITCTTSGSVVTKARVSGQSPCGGGTCSEGMGYGLLIAANMADQEYFNAFFNYVDQYMPVVSGSGSNQAAMVGSNTMPWSTNGCEATSVTDYNNAPDGDEDIIMGLLQGYKRWGTAAYLNLAYDMIQSMATKNIEVYNNLTVLKKGGLTSDAVSGGVFPSYFAPGYYRQFAALATAKGNSSLATTYTNLANDTLSLLAHWQVGMTSANTGSSILNSTWPEYANSVSLSTTITGQGYWWNAARQPWRIAVDYAWYSTASAGAQLKTAAAANFNPVSSVDSGRLNSGFVGALALAHMPNGSTELNTAVTQWLTASGLSDTNYYQATLKLVYMLLAAGKFPAAY